MKKEQVFWLLSVQTLLLFSIIKNPVSVSGQCLGDQRSYLLNLKNSLKSYLQSSTKLVQWNPEEDCCSWRGVGCDASGRVIALDLKNEGITCAADNLTSLFRLQFLENLSLEDNNLNIPIPKSIANLTRLVSLNLGYSGFVGQIPIELSSLRNLVSLHLTTNSNLRQLTVENPSLEMLIHNLSNIEEIYLDGINLSALGSEWFRVIATSLPKLRVLSLGDCNLLGQIPEKIFQVLEVLNLAGNNLNGSIPNTFDANCSLKTLELGMNNLQGKLPRGLSNCNMLEVLNIGNNKIEDVFPCMFVNFSTIRVLILRSNNFHGEFECFGYNYNWPELRIIDIASNNFSGVLSTHFFSSLKNMSTLTPPWTFTSIDFSNNKFSGNIPESIGDLNSLFDLNLSHNQIIGGIPSSIGKLRNLGSLDLSRNQLSGEIPSTLKYTFSLAFLNLSFNMLIGKIPTGHQLETFSNDSYIGNVGLCGFPLNVRCVDVNYSGSSSMPSLSNNKEFNWMYVCVSVGYIVGLGIFSMFLLFCVRWRNKLFLRVDQFQVKIFGSKWKEPIRRL